MHSSINKVTKFTFFICTAAIFLVAFEWSIAEIITPFLSIPLMFLALLVFTISFAVSGYFFFQFHRYQWRAITPLSTHIATVLIVLYVPFNELWIKADFYVYQTDREQVISDIESGKLASTNTKNNKLVKLTMDYANVSAGGNEVIVEQLDGLTYVFFFTFRGLLDNYSGFLYVPNGGHPRIFEDLHETNLTQITRYSDNWYYTTHR